jgi:pyruvate formate lyase activating enzyme
VPLHFTAFHPDFKLRDKPPTPPETLHQARRIALEAGLHYVYEGNIVTNAGSTFCPKCKLRVVRRSWHKVEEDLLRGGKCPQCACVIAGVWQKGIAE